MVAEAKFEDGGRLTIPKEVMQEMGAREGDLVTLRTIAPGTIVLVLSTSDVGDRLDQRSHQFPGRGAEGASAVQDPAVAELMDPQTFRPLSAAELFDRYKFDRPVDEARDRKEWEDEAFHDVIGR